MVLEDVSTPSDAVDRYYSGDQNPTILETRSPSSYPIQRPNGLPPLHINLAGLPMPWFPFGQSTAERAAHKSLGEGMQKISDEYMRILHRPIEQSEADALAFHMAKAIRLNSFGPPIGMAVASGLAIRGISTYRFPGWTPGPKFNPERFLFMKGTVARMAWQSLRFNAYFAVGVVLSEVFAGSYAMTVGTVGRLQDPRLKDLNEAMNKKAQEKLKGKGVPIEDRTAGKRGTESFEMARQRQWAQNAGTRGGGDDMSPTGGAFSDDLADTTGQAVDMGMLSDSQIQQLQQTEQRTQRQQDEAPSSVAATPQSSARTGPQSTSPSPSSEPASQPSGSAWDRLRQQATQQTPRRPEQQSGRRSRETIEDDGDAFGFSDRSANDQALRESQSQLHELERRLPLTRQGSENMQPSKSDAQKEFDAQLERERQGQNFDDKGGSGGGRW